MPRLPIEAAKATLLPADPARASAAQAVVVPSRPLPVLFTDAWQAARSEPGAAVRP